jgi:hypothetical protein
MKYATVTIGTAKLPWPALALALAAAPMIAVMGMRALTNRHVVAPPNGGADIIVSGQFIQPELPKPTPESAALQMTFDNECSQPFGPSPMVNRAPKPVQHEPVTSSPVVAEKPVTPNQAPTPPSVTVTSIMTGQGQVCAIISGKVRRVGDSVGNGFVITSIDGTAGKVEIANGDVQATLQLKRPQGE